MLLKKNKKKCFTTLFYHFSSYFFEKIYFLIYIIRKKNFWLNFGLFLPRTSNFSNNSSLLNSFNDFNIKVPENFPLDSVRSHSGKFQLKIYYSFVFGLSFFSSYFFNLFKQMRKLFEKFKKNNLYLKKKSYKNLRFYNFQKNSNIEIEFQKTFNYYLCNKIK